ncbi:hypothetical protein NLI96_g3626 [Meripilus lineatus]|uniref:Uncharacterized protein n=1 Tax=Meripilus lineatus TaxID=2056292 RepID=A0AAD5YKN9_9APHY|nr:hypothetical protein NLI96_g3626 [Physisporinus lineatus]
MHIVRASPFTIHRSTLDDPDVVCSYTDISLVPVPCGDAGVAVAEDDSRLITDTEGEGGLSTTTTTSPPSPSGVFAPSLKGPIELSIFSKLGTGTCPPGLNNPPFTTAPPFKFLLPLPEAEPWIISPNSVGVGFHEERCKNFLDGFFLTLALYAARIAAVAAAVVAVTAEAFEIIELVVKVDVILGARCV